jgi:hypothetical protein
MAHPFPQNSYKPYQRLHVNKKIRVNRCSWKNKRKWKNVKKITELTIQEINTFPGNSIDQIFSNLVKIGCSRLKDQSHIHHCWRAADQRREKNHVKK